ncbi:MAG: TetR/AcrR family transcriptional regulator [Bacteroidota bacterium]
MPRHKQSDWLALGFRMLAAFDYPRFTVQYLCEQMGLTKGSFYHHFQGIEGFITALMKSWEAQNTQAFITQANQEGDMRERLAALLQQVREADQTVEAAIRAWSFSQPLVKEHLDRVDQARIQYLKSLFEGFGLSDTLALDRAKLDYAGLIGLQMLYPHMGAREMQRLYESHPWNPVS